MLRNMATSLFKHERVETTEAKAKELRPFAERLITLARRGDLHARRQVLRIIRDKEVVAKLFTSLSDRFKDRPGGYTRILKMGFRHGDNAPMAMFELMPEDLEKKPGSKKRRSRRPKKKDEAVEKPAVEEAAAEESAISTEEPSEADSQRQEEEADKEDQA